MTWNLVMTVSLSEKWDIFLDIWIYSYFFIARAMTEHSSQFSAEMDEQVQLVGLDAAGFASFWRLAFLSRCVFGRFAFEGFARLAGLAVSAFDLASEAALFSAFFRLLDRDFFFLSILLSLSSVTSILC